MRDDESVNASGNVNGNEKLIVSVAGARRSVVGRRKEMAKRFQIDEERRQMYLGSG